MPTRRKLDASVMPELASAARVEARGDRACVGVETFGLCQRDGGRSKIRQRPRIAGDKRRALHEIEHRKAGGEACGARGGQYVIGSGNIISDRLGRVAAEEDRARVA